MKIESIDDGDLEQRSYDHSWIAENLHSFAPLARDGFQYEGRGAVLVNLAELILRKHSEEGHPFNYHPQSEGWINDMEFESETTRTRLSGWLDQYSPEAEFVLVLVKHNRFALHRISLPLEHEMDAEIRGAYVEAEMDERYARLAVTDFWARQYHLTSPHTGEWLYRVSGPSKR